METEPPPSLLLIQLFNQLSLADFFSVFMLIILLLFSAMVSGSEVAFFSLSKKDLDEAQTQNKAGITTIQRLLKNKRKLLATILILNNFINIAIVLLSAYLSRVLVHPYLPEISLFGKLVSLTLIFDLVVITFLLLFFGEILPKIYAGRNTYNFAKFMSKSLSVMVKTFAPVSSLLIGMSTFVESKLKKHPSISVDQLSQALELTQEDETTTNEEQKILEGIVNFGNTDTAQIMTPRVDMFAIKYETPYQKVIEQIAANGYSRIPVYNNQIDDIVGILYAKDLIPFLDKTDYQWNQLLRKPFFVPENKKLNDLLADFQERRNHLAVVVDEYGGTSGLVSLEDVIEEIVGDISDEFDDDDITYSKLDDDNYIFEGKTSLKDFCRVVGADSNLIDSQKGEAETLAGLMLELTDSYPKNRQKISTQHFDFIIEALDKKRIKQIKVTKKQNNES